MKVLVAGGAGFIGRRVCTLLRSSGHEVMVLDNLSAGQAPRVDVPLLCRDVREVRASELPDVDALVHLAGEPSVAASERDPAGAWSVHFGGTEALLSAAAGRGVARFVFVSSAAAGTVAEAPSPYAAAKRAAERLVRRASGHFRGGVHVVRPFNVYGPHQRYRAGDGPVVPAFFAAVRADRAIPVRDAAYTRDFVHVDDVSWALARLAVGPDVGAHPLDLGTGRGTTIGALARMVARLTGRELRTERLAGTGGVRRSVADPRRLRALGCAPAVGLEVGLRRLVMHGMELAQGADGSEPGEPVPRAVQ